MSTPADLAGGEWADLDRLVLLTRPECGLCESMHAEIDALRRLRPLPPLQLMDVDSDAELARRYGLRIPVLLLGGALVCEHHFDATELLRLLRRIRL